MTGAQRLRAPHVLVGALCAGLAASLALRRSELVLPLAGAALAALGLLVGPQRTLPLAASLAAAGAWWGSARLEALDASPLAGEIGVSAPVRVEVTGPARAGRFALAVPVRVLRFGDRGLREPARLELPLERAPPQGAILELVATVRRPRVADDDEDFDEAEYLRRQGVQIVLHADWFREVGRRGGLPGLADRLRHVLRDSIGPGLSGERRALIAGVVLGEDEGLSEDLREDFRASGLYHLLAVSGQNVAYVVFGALLLAWLVGAPRWAGHCGALLAIGGYVLAVGWQPSVVRAGVAGSLASLAWLVARPADRWYFLLVGAAVLLAVNPYSALEPGFQLSFAAVAAIFVAVPRLERRLEGYPLPRRLAEVVAVSAACGVATAPIVWLHFGAVPVFSVVSNALAAPVVAPMLGLAFVSAGLGDVAPAAAAALSWVNGWLAAYLARCARAVGGLPHAEAASAEGLLAIAVATLLVGVAVRLRPPRGRRLVALGAMAATLVLAWKVWLAPGGAPPPVAAGLRITFLDVGQGDAILLQVREGAVLVDQGPPEGEVADQLAGLGVTRLSALVLTHPQRDHVGGAADVIRDVDIGAVLDPGIPAESPDERAALAAAQARGITVRIVRAGRAYRIGRLRLRVLWPEGPGPPGDDPNNHAIVLVASYGETDVLLTADAESNVTLPLRPPQVEILKVAHHGSADAGLPDLLELVRPRLAVISVGRHNDYGHPAPSTLTALARVPGLAVSRTDLDGRVVVETDGERLAIREER